MAASRLVPADAGSPPLARGAVFAQHRAGRRDVPAGRRGRDDERRPR
ncbi:MAG: hypothetical protein QM702_15635 [Rubrivivax sp.]